MPPCLVKSRALELPIAVESAGWIVPFGDELRLLVNQPGDGTTAQYRFRLPNQIDELSPLPGVVAGACECSGKLIVTAANEKGQPLVLTVAADGSVLWQVALAGEMPIRWPVPGCGDARPVIAWQTEFGKIESGVVAADGLSQQSSFSAGGPPLDVAVAGGSVWAIWSDATGVFAAENTPGRRREIKLDETYTSQLAIAADGDSVWVAWERDRGVFLARIDPGGQQVAPTSKSELSEDAGGSLAVIPGPQPLLLLRRLIEDEEGSRWRSVLATAGDEPCVIDGMIHSAAWWHEMVAALSPTQLLFLRKTLEHEESPRPTVVDT